MCALLPEKCYINVDKNFPGQEIICGSTGDEWHTTWHCSQALCPQVLGQLIKILSYEISIFLITVVLENLMLPLMASQSFDVDSMNIGIHLSIFLISSIQMEGRKVNLALGH